MNFQGIAVGLVLCLSDPVLAEDPWGPEGRHPPLGPVRAWQGPLPESRTHVVLGNWGFQLYRRLISPADGASCGFHPTCSLYGFRALKSKGPLLGWILTMERILRDHGEIDAYAKIQVHGQLRLYDPPWANAPGAVPLWPWFSQWPVPVPQPGPRRILSLISD